jgi:ABC-2 type transport system permease protein
MKFEIERRVEECLVSDTLGPQYVGVYSSIKQPLNFHFNDVNDLYNKAEQDVSWLGYSLGYVMIVFLMVFGTNIARSITREKANRISEVLLASVKPFELMMGKILGVLWSSLFQLFCWIVLVGLGLWIFQEVLLEDYFNGYLKGVQMSPEEWRQLGMGGYAQVNEGISLFYNQLNYGFLIPNFILFFLSTYWVYASFFTIIGALSGDDADGQQFILPIWLLFGLSIYAGYNATLYPDSAWTSFFAIFPWTSGMVSMVKVTMGVSLSSYLLMLISWSVSMVVGAMMLVLAGRVFKNGILSYSHKLTLSLLFKWLKR